MEQIIENLSDYSLSLLEHCRSLLEKVNHPRAEEFARAVEEKNKEGDWLEGQDFIKNISRVKPPGGLGAVNEEPAQVDPSTLDKWVGEDHQLQELGYDYRPAQEKMARQVIKGFNQSRPVLVEAATGTGKGMAYLSAALEWHRKTGRKILISTHTKTLQDQLLGQDLPRLNSKLSDELKVSVLKGMPNYLCLRKFMRVTRRENLTREEAESAVKLLVEAVQNNNGDLDRFGSQPFGEQIRALPTTRLYGDCPYYERCFVSSAWRAAKDADIVVTNHALFLALYSQLEELPAEEVIIDEAHHLPEMAEHIFGFEIPSWRWAYWKKRIDTSTRFYKQLNRVGNLLSEKSTKFLSDWKGRMDRFAGVWDAFWASIEAKKWPLKFYDRPDLLKEVKKRSNPGKVQEQLNYWSGGLMRIEKELEDEQKALAGEVAYRRKGLEELRDNFKFFFGEGKNHVRWIDKQEDTKIIKSTPLHCASLLEEILTEKCRSVTMTSATLAVNDSFNFIKKKTGLSGGNYQVTLNTPFDYSRQAEFVLVKNGPFPAKTNQFYSYLERAVRSICRQHSGRTLVLFNSFRVLNEL
ncbi:MAG: ATP-dependent DNA helicase, partial [bacterium]